MAPEVLAHRYMVLVYVPRIDYTFISVDAAQWATTIYVLNTHIMLDWKKLRVTEPT